MTHSRGAVDPYVLVAAPAAAGTTFDPAGANALSNGNLTVTSTGAGVTLNRSVKSITTGKYVCDFILTNFATASSTPVGLVDATDALAVSSGFGLANRTTGLGLQLTDGNVYGGGSFAVIGTGVTGGGSTGSRITMAVDMTNRRVWFQINRAGNWNGSGTANPATNIGGFTIPAGITTAHIAAYVSGATNAITIDSDPSVKPSGFVGWTAVTPIAIDVLVVAGQSNASGFADDASSLSYPLDPNVMTWNGSAFVTYQPNTVTGMEWAASGGYWGAEMRYSQLYRVANPTKRMAIIKFAAAGTQLFQSADGTGTYDWNTASSAELYAQAGTQVTNALAALTTAGYTPTVRLVWWMQGEDDAADSTKGAAYQTNLTNLINGMRSTWSVSGTTKVAVGRIRTGGTASSAVRAAQLAVATANPGGPVVIMNTDDVSMSADFVHYNKAGLITVGSRLWDIDQGTYTEPAS